MVIVALESIKPKPKTRPKDIPDDSDNANELIDTDIICDDF